MMSYKPEFIGLSNMPYKIKKYLLVGNIVGSETGTAIVKVKVRPMARSSVWVVDRTSNQITAKYVIGCLNKASPIAREALGHKSPSGYWQRPTPMSRGISEPH